MLDHAARYYTSKLHAKLERDISDGIFIAERLITFVLSIVQTNDEREKEREHLEGVHRRNCAVEIFLYLYV